MTGQGVLGRMGAQHANHPLPFIDAGGGFVAVLCSGKRICFRPRLQSLTTPPTCA